MDDLMDFQLTQKETSIIKVIGVGGGGSNAVNFMYKQGITGVDFVVCNTDNQALDASPVDNKIHLGRTLTEGMGAGSKPEIGRQAAIENLMDVEEMLNENARMVFITAGMGGGTGTGAAPVIAEAAKNKGLLTVGIVTIPFLFEGEERINKALDGVEEMQHHVDALLVINNEKLQDMFGNLALSQAFAKADSVLTTAAKGIAEIITLEGYVNVDFKDVESVMKDSGVAIMGSGFASGEDRAVEAIEEALLSPLLNNNDVGGARKILLHITSGTDEIRMDEVKLITDHLKLRIGSNASIIWGVGNDEKLGDKVGVSVIATGFRVGNVHKGLSSEQKEVTRDKIKTVTLDDEVPVQPKDDSTPQQSFSFEANTDKPREVEFEVTKSKPEDRLSRYYRESPAPVQPKQENELSASLEEISDTADLGTINSLSDKDLENDKYIDYIDSVPAYARKKRMGGKEDEVQVSTFSVHEQNGEWKIQDNKFINGNVD